MAAEQPTTERLALALAPPGARPAAPSAVEGAAGRFLARERGKAPRNKGKSPEMGSSSAAEAVGDQPNPRDDDDDLDWTAAPVADVAMPPPTPAYPVDERERDVLLIKLLRSTVDAVAIGKLDLASDGMRWVADLASPDGRSLQRLASAFAEALALYVIVPFHGLCRLLQLPQAAPPGEVAAARHRFRGICPFVRIAGASANLSILEAMDNEEGVVHVVDLGGSDINQWVELVRLFAARPRGPPGLLRVTVVNEADDVLSAAEGYLTAEAQRLDINFTFRRVQSSIDALTGVGGALGIVAGQSLAVIANLQMHRLLAYRKEARNGKGPAGEQSAQHTMTTKADALLRAIRGLSPKLMVLTEQEADHNVDELQPRVWNAMNYYAALFDAVEESAPLVSPGDRASVERWLLGEEIRDIVVCVGSARRERHEKLERWGARMVAAGFSPATMAKALGMTEALARQVAAGGGAGAAVGVLRAVQAGGCFPMICWSNKPVFSVSTWTVRRSVVRPPEAAADAGASGSHHGGGPASSSAAMVFDV